MASNSPQDSTPCIHSADQEMAEAARDLSLTVPSSVSHKQGGGGQALAQRGSRLLQRAPVGTPTSLFPQRDGTGDKQHSTKQKKPKAVANATSPSESAIVTPPIRSPSPFMDDRPGFSRSDLLFEYPDSLQLVPPPIEGFPSVGGMTSAYLRENVDDATLEKYIPVRNYCFAYIAFDTTEDDKAANAEIIAELLRTAFELRHVTVTAGGMPSSGKKSKLFQVYLITGLPTEYIEALVRRRVWSTPKLTLFVFPSTTFFSRFVVKLSISGKKVQKSTAISTALRKQVNSVIKEDPTVRKMLCDFSKTHYGDRLSAKEMRKIIMSTFDAVPIGKFKENSATLTYNVYIDPPCDDNETYNTWLQVMRKVLSSCPNATQQPNVNCDQCRSIDHTKRNCPFYQVPGWHSHL